MSPFCILVPLDGTPQSNAALPVVKALARPLQAEVLLVRVAANEEEVSSEAQPQLDGVAREVRGVNLPVQTATPIGKPAEQILAQVRSASADLVVMATRHAGVERLLLGSVATEVVRHSPVPVVVLRAGQRRLSAVRRILVPLDEDAESARILPAVKALAPALGAEIVLLRVLSAFPAPQGDWVAGATEDLLADFRVQAERDLQRVAADLNQLGLSVRSLIGQTPVVDAILAAVDAEQVDLVAMATHARGGLERAVLGSIADEVIHRSPVPVLTVSLPAADE